MKRTLCLTLLLTFWTSLFAESGNYEITRFETPIQLGPSGYVESAPKHDWAMPMLARKAMKTMAFDEWRKHWSVGFFEKTKIDNTRFADICARPLPTDSITWSFFAEVRLTHEGVDYILIYGCSAPRSEFPANEAELNAMVSTDFFRFENGNWINWSTPHDMDFNAPLSKLIDYREVMGFAK